MTTSKMSTPPVLLCTCYGTKVPADGDWCRVGLLGWAFKYLNLNAVHCTCLSSFASVYLLQYQGTWWCAVLGSFVGPAAQHESDNQGIVNLNPPPCTPPPSTQKSPNHPKPFKSPPPPFWVSLFPFHSFSASHHHLYMVKTWSKSSLHGEKMIKVYCV